MYTTKMRMNCIIIEVNADLEMNYKLSLPIKEEHVPLIDRDLIRSYIVKNKIRYVVSYETTDREAVLKVMRSAQLIIQQQKNLEGQLRVNRLLEKLSQPEQKH